MQVRQFLDRIWEGDEVRPDGPETKIPPGPVANAFLELDLTLRGMSRR